MTIQYNRDSSTDERCSGEIGARTRRAEVAQRYNEQDETDPIPDKAEYKRTGQIWRGRELRPEPNSQRRVRSSGDQAFDSRDDARVRRRDLSR